MSLGVEQPLVIIICDVTPVSAIDIPCARAQRKERIFE